MSTKELNPVSEGLVGKGTELIRIEVKEGVQVVSAKELYNFLGFDKSHWSRWYAKNIENNDFALENVDYHTLAIMANGNETKDFVITIDFAKRLSMLARTEKGEQIRRYFIEMEKVAKDKMKQMSQLDILANAVAVLQEQERKLLQIENNVGNLEDRVLKVESKQMTKNEDYYTITGFGNLQSRKIPRDVASKLGKQCSSICKNRNIEIGKEYDAKYGQINAYPLHILKEVFNQYFN